MTNIIVWQIFWCQLFLGLNSISLCNIPCNTTCYLHSISCIFEGNYRGLCPPLADIFILVCAIWMRKLMRKRVFFERICARDIRLLHASLLRFNQKACLNIGILSFFTIIEKYEIHTIFSVYKPMEMQIFIFYQRL